MLGSFLKSVFRSPHEAGTDIPDCTTKSELGKKVLNVGGNNKSIPIPDHYEGWEHILLDIDAAANPDVVCDARNLMVLPESAFDSVYCSHNLEHYYKHDVEKVLAGFLHVLNDGGFAYIRVPDLKEVMRRSVEGGFDIEDVLYVSAVGPITVRDVIYGYGKEIEVSGNDFYAHKTGFTQKSLETILRAVGFSFVYSNAIELEIIAIAFKARPNDQMVNLFNIDLPPL